MCHPWHNNICEAAASGNFHLHAHMFLRTEKIRKRRSPDITQISFLMRKIGRPYFISLEGKFRRKSLSVMRLGRVCGKLTQRCEGLWFATQTEQMTDNENKKEQTKLCLDWKTIKGKTVLLCKNYFLFLKKSQKNY